jgi:hypothetical protein
VFTPALHQFENEKVEPILYPFGGTGPNEARSLALRLSV